MKNTLIIIFGIFLIFPCSLYAETNCSKNTLCIETIKKKNVVHFYAENKKLYTVSVRITVTKQNMETDVDFPAIIVLK
ncbi:MAG: hypothetical protein JSV71_04835, partial [Nitrospiraceae bacterium]